MLYNYPKRNLDDLFNLVNLNSEHNKNKMVSVLGVSFQIMESQTNFLKNVNESIEHSFNQQNISMNQTSFQRRNSFELHDIKFLNKGSKQVPLPTTLNNKMKLMTNIIF